jgi:hypothetical protein
MDRDTTWFAPAPYPVATTSSAPSPQLHHPLDTYPRPPSTGDTYASSTAPMPGPSIYALPPPPSSSNAASALAHPPHRQLYPPPGPVAEFLASLNLSEYYHACAF